MSQSFEMSRRRFVGGALAASAATAMPFAAFAQASAAPASSANWPRVSAMMAQYVNSGKVANMVAGLGWGQDDPQFIARGYNSFSSQIESGPDTLYRIYSMTKPVTGMAVMMCVEDGLLAIDQPIAEIIPAFAEMQVQKEYDGPITPDNLEPAVRPITVRHCLTHTAGLGYSIVQQGPLADAYRAAGVVPGQVSRLEVPGAFRGDSVDSLELFADNLARLPLVYQPGTQWSYGVGLDLLGRVIEVVSGQSFDSFLKSRIFDPAGMDSTTFRVKEDDIARFTANYLIVDDMLVPVDLPDNSIYLDEPPCPFGGAGLVSSARDYDRFLRMLAGFGEIDGTRIMAEETVRLATSDLFADTVPDAGRFQFGERSFGFGAGGLVGTGEAEGLFGWFGAAGTCGLVNMKWGLRHNLMTQYMPSQVYGLQNEFPVMVAGDAIAQLQDS